jgi:hypothetical protein
MWQSHLGRKDGEQAYIPSEPTDLAAFAPWQRRRGRLTPIIRYWQSGIGNRTWMQQDELKKPSNLLLFIGCGALSLALNVLSRRVESNWLDLSMAAKRLNGKEHAHYKVVLAFWRTLG